MDASGTRLPTPGAFTGKFQRIMEGAKDWNEVAKRLKGETVTYFDFETTGIPDYDGQDITNDPVQLGAVQVKDGKIVKRFNVYINPESKLSEWSASNLKRDVLDENGDITLDDNGKPVSTLVTPEWLEGQMSQEQALQEFIDFIGPGALLGGQNVPFDVEILKRMADKYGIDLDIAGTIDSKDLASLLPKYDPEKGIDGPRAPDRRTGEIKATSSLGPVANFLGFEPANWHSADGDAEDSYNLVTKIIERAGKEGSKDLSLLDFPAMQKRYQERMAEFQAVVDPKNPITDSQKSALEKFAASDKPQVAAKAKEALQTAHTRGAAAAALTDIHNEDAGRPSERRTGLFNEYSADRLDQTAENEPLTDFGYDPEDEVTIYRGVPSGVNDINSGDWVTDNPQLAKDYAGEGGKVISMKVKAKDLLTDRSSGFEGKGTGFVEEMVYRPAAKDSSIEDNLPDLPQAINKEESDSDFEEVDADLEAELERRRQARLAAKQQNTPAPTPAEEPKPTGVTAAVSAIRAAAAKFGLTLKKGQGQNRSLSIGTEEAPIERATTRRAVRPSADSTAAMEEVRSAGRAVIDEADAEVTRRMVARGELPEGVTVQEHAVALQKARDDAYSDYLKAAGEVSNPHVSEEEANALVEELEAEYGIPGLAKKYRENPGYIMHYRLAPAERDYASYPNLNEAELAELRENTRKYVEFKQKLEALSKEYVIDYGRNSLHLISSNPYMNLQDLVHGLIAIRKKEAVDDLRTKAAEAKRLYSIYDPLPSEHDIVDTYHREIGVVTKELLTKAGMKFDSVKLEDFGDRLRDSTGKPISPKSKLGKEILKSWEFLPRNVIIAGLDHLKEKSKVLKYRDSKARGHFDANADANTYLIRSNNADVFLHEFWHFVQLYNPNTSNIEHAWLYSRMVRPNGSLPRTIQYASDTQPVFGVLGLAEEYSAKQYPPRREPTRAFSPENLYTEVGTMGVQDLFTRPGVASKPGGVMVTTGSGKNKRTYKDPYQDPATGIWYTDSSKQTKLDITGIFGRAKSEGADLDYKALTVGMLMAFFDWND